jgi:Luciferase-like monooxygenase
LLLAHRPGFVSPTLAARKLATLDQLSGGRLAVHIIAGGSDPDQAKDGDYTDHAGRYRRVSEYIDLLRRTWTSPAPLDHVGEFYRVSGAYSDIRCMQTPHIPVYGGGGSNDAIQALAPQVDHYMLWGEPLRETAAFMAQVRQAAVAAGKSPLEGSGMFSVYLMLLFAFFGYFMKKFDFSFVTFLIGFILGPMAELSLRQAMIITDGKITSLTNHPIALLFLALAALSIWRLSTFRRIRARMGDEQM